MIGARASAMDRPIEAEPPGRSRSVAAILRRDRGFWIGLGITVALVSIAVLAPLIAPHDPTQQFRREGRTPQGDPVGPTAKFLLGTDKQGRDYLSRLIFGARTSLTVAILSNVAAAAIGMFVGSTAAFVGTRVVRMRLPRGRGVTIALPVESLLMRATDVALAFPSLLIAIALVATLGPSLVLIASVIAAFLWTATARVVYGRVLVIQESAFVTAARAVGASESRVLLRHILPHVMSVLAVYTALGVSGAILFEVTLSYLGVGVPPPAPSWGSMIAEGFTYYATQPRLVLLPGLAVMLTIAGFTLLGDALRDALDPQQGRH